MFIIPISKGDYEAVIWEFEITFDCTIVDFVIIIYMYFCFLNEALLLATPIKRAGTFVSTVG